MSVSKKKLPNAIIHPIDGMREAVAADRSREWRGALTATTAPNNGIAAEMGNQCLRVDRGGSWHYATWLLRSATRERNPADYRDQVMGFRVARTLP